MVALLVSVSSFASAAQPIETPEIRAAVENAATQSDHEAVAKQYEDAASELQAKAGEKKELLEHYQDKSYLYGRRAQDLQSHTSALIRHYEKTVRATMQAAASHRQMASRFNENHAASSTQAPDTVSGL